MVITLHVTDIIQLTTYYGYSEMAQWIYLHCTLTKMYDSTGQ